MKIHEQIAFYRKQKGLTQEDLAKTLGVTNQAVSKWESAQCCPDIQLLPSLAAILDISVDELLGNAPIPASESVIPALRRKIEALPKGEDFDFTFRTAALLHAVILSKGMAATNPGWDTDGAIEHAGRAEWGYSCCNIPEITTTMRHGAVFFSNNRDLHLANNQIRRIVSIIKPFTDAESLKTAAALFGLTVHSEEAYASIGLISERSGLPADTIRQCLTGPLAPFILEKDGAESAFRFDGMYMNILPVLSLLDFK